MAKQLYHPSTSNEPIVKSESKQIIESTTCEASDIKAQDGTIAEMDKKGFSYIDSTMIYGGTIVMRFKKR
jgi:hypothetical protein